MKYKGPVIISICFVMGIFLIANLVHSQNTDIVISEICPRGCASNKVKQWIEIYNKGYEPVDISGWKFYVKGEYPHGINTTTLALSFIIEPGEYAVIAENYIEFLKFYTENNNGKLFDGKLYDSTWGSLGAEGEEIGLKDPKNFVENDMPFTYSAVNTSSLERINFDISIASSSAWIENRFGQTPGEENYCINHDCTIPNQPPVATISTNSSVVVNETVIFDASGSSDSDGSIVSYVWNFGDGGEGNGVNVNHRYIETGIFTVILTVADDDSEIGIASLDVTVSSGEVEIVETTTSTSQTLVINEFVSNPNTYEKEWVEIFNNGTSTIDLTGWTLSDGVGVFASPTGIINEAGFLVVELNSAKLNNSGDIIILKNIEGEIIDQVCFGNWNEGCLGENVDEPDKGNAVARIVDGQDTDNDKNDWAETTTPTKGESNIITAPVNNTPAPTGGGGGSTIVPIITFSEGSIIINELVSDPTDGAEEFVELYNKTSQTISLANWWLEDGSEAKTSLTGSISAGGFFVIEKPKGNLNNAGDIIILFAPDGQEIDKVTYGTWDDGNINDNAVSPSDPLSLARKVDGQDSNNDYYDFVLTSTITKGKSNIISSVTKDGEVIEQILTSAKIIINEVLPNPAGTDNNEEFIEIKNLGEETVNLKDWQLSDAGTRKYKITQGSVSAGGYIVFKRSMTGIALNNTGGDEIKLYSPSGSLVDSIKYSGSASDDTSYARLDDGGWKWTTKLTPGKDNIIEGKSAAPIISIDVDTEVAVSETIMFDASDTTDPDGETMSFSWDFNDGNEGTGVVVGHAFNTEGVFTVKLSVVNASNSSAEKKVIITVKNRLAFVGGYDGNNNITKIAISEFVPNPTGSDTTEFIELFNPTDEDLDLSDFKLDDEEGGSRAYTLPAGTIIPAGAYVVFGRQDTKLALNNTSDSVRLLYPDGTVLKEVRYDDVPEGASYVQDENEVWQWTGVITPGEANIINSVKEKTTARKVSKSKYVKPLITTTLEKLRDEDVGDRVRVTGVVAVEPGVLGTQYFYIVGSQGVQVYMYKKDFPNLKVGDRIEVTGEITESYGNTRVKLASRDDIKKIDHPGDPQPQVVNIADVGEPLEGWFIEINGEITEIKGSYIYVDDGTEEVQVYFKTGTGINKKILQVGDLVTIQGLVYQTKSGYQVLPRSQEDIVKTGVTEDAVVQIATSAEENKKEVAEKYLTATAGGLTSILFGLFAKARGAAAFGFVKKFGGLAVAVIRRRPKV